MNKQNVSLAAAVAASLFLLVFLTHNIASYNSKVQGEDTAVIVPPPPATGTINSFYSLIYGPNICTAYGDPFSPLIRTWADAWPPDGVPYSYQYRILIPPDYPTDVLRVEIFDPDSINQAENIHHVSFTLTAIGQDSVTYPLSGIDLSCSSIQRDSCLIETGEIDLVDPIGPPIIDLDQINPFWFVRVDENRGYGADHGTSGVCGIPDSYTPRYNTATLYELFYYVQNADGTITRVDLARYTGQVGDNDRDNGNHQTDMHWVSPGGTMLYDQPTSVPVDPGSPGDFELSISNDFPGIIIDPYTNKRTIFLNITSLQGASGNGFDIWAGPLHPDISSNVNVRNIQLTNDPQAHDAQGVFVEPIGILPIHSAYDYPYEMPLMYIDADFAGESVFISLFDTDGGTQPPITFYFDTIAEEDWSLMFGAGDPDPDGVSGRCLPGDCNNQWVNPSYEIDIPGILDNCDWENPTQRDCTPFYGGYLMVNYDAGPGDTHVWQFPIIRPQATVKPQHSQIDTTPGITATHIFTTNWLTIDRMNNLTVTGSAWSTHLNWYATINELGVTQGTITVTVSPPDTVWVSDIFTLTLDIELYATGTTRTTMDGLFLPHRVYLPLASQP